MAGVLLKKVKEIAVVDPEFTPKTPNPKEMGE